jgi:hypothetical protein
MDIFDKIKQEINKLKNKKQSKHKRYLLNLYIFFSQLLVVFSYFHSVSEIRNIIFQKVSFSHTSWIKIFALHLKSDRLISVNVIRYFYYWQTMEGVITFPPYGEIPKSMTLFNLKTKPSPSCFCKFAE